MNKTELIEKVAESAELSKAAASRALDAVTETITAALKKGGEVTITGFGTFVVAKRAARKGRNPQTGDEIKIKASKAPRFRPGKTLKDAVNGGK